MQHEPRLIFPGATWLQLTRELHRRTEACHESGAFLLGEKTENSRFVRELLYYEELDPNAYSTGVCVLHADAFGRLWDRCAATGLSVIGDVHVHGLGSGQSREDRENPMIARAGHLAVILPYMARPPVRLGLVGLYEYLGGHRWRSHGGRDVARLLKIGDGK